MDRLNPILMTALSSALALIPLAVAGDPARQRNTKPHGQGDPRGTAHLDPAERIHRSDRLQTDKQQKANHMTRYITLLATLLVCGAGLYAQDKNLSEAEILRTVELNCPVLKNIAATADARNDTGPDRKFPVRPTIRLHPHLGQFRRGGRGRIYPHPGLRTSPRAYAQRNKAAKANAQVANANYQALRTEQLALRPAVGSGNHLPGKNAKR